MSLKNTIEEAIQTLKAERLRSASERSPLWRRSGGVIRARDPGRLVVVGDLHGHPDAFKAARDLVRDRRVCEGGLAVFLGDYIDRGPAQDLVLEGVLSLKLECPDSVILLRGNHEPPEGFEPYPHDFIHRLMLRYRDYREIYGKARELFDELPYALVMEGRALLVHGGPPAQAFLQARDNPLAEGQWPPPLDVLLEVLWNDPSEWVEYASPSPRGVGYLWGPRVTEAVLSSLGVARIIRGHEPADGLKYNHGKRVVTVFTYFGPPYFNERGVILYCDSPDKLLSDVGECAVEVS